MKLSPCPVKQAALSLGLEVHQPTKVRTGNLHEWLIERRVEVAVVLAYGRILPNDVLRAPRLGCINLHASLLPKYRGAAPIQWALIQGERQTGISLMQMDEGLDTGPVYSRRTIDISPEMTAGELAERMAQLAAEVVREDLTRVFTGAVPTPQDHEHATFAPPIEARHCAIDWSQSAEQVVGRIHGLSPRPGASTTLPDPNPPSTRASAANTRLKLLRARVLDPRAVGTPGQITACAGDLIVVATGAGSVQILEAQLPGKRALPARDIVNGRSLRVGMTLGH